jgi:phage head maturation protease
MVTNREIVRRVKRGELLEVSPVTFPAYPTTSAQVRDHVAALLRAQQSGLEPAAEAELARARRAAERMRHLQLYGGL